jgi:hypothetical protein
MGFSGGSSTGSAAGACFLSLFGSRLDDVNDFGVEQLHGLPDKGMLRRLSEPLLMAGWGRLLQALRRNSAGGIGKQLEIDANRAADDSP